METFNGSRVSMVFRVFLGRVSAHEKARALSGAGGDFNFRRLQRLFVERLPLQSRLALHIPYHER